MNSDQKRSFFRCAVDIELAGTIWWKRGRKTRDASCRILDQSAGGFGVMADAGAEFEKGEKIILGNEDRHLLCEIVHVGASGKNECKLGLRTIEELHEAPEKENVGSEAGSDGVRASSFMAPVICAAVVSLLTLGGYAYYEYAGRETDDDATLNDRITTTGNQVYERFFRQAR